MNERTCKIDGCDKPARAQRTICSMHRRRWEKHRSYDDPRPTTLRRFTASYVEDDNGCWRWQATISDRGYGQIGERGVTVYAHRWSYEHFIGAIPDGLQIDHLCRVRNCVNPEHLEPVTALVNNRRGESPWSINARKTHCIRGHEFTSANTRVNRHGWRSCIACAHMHNAARKTKTAA